MTHSIQTHMYIKHTYTLNTNPKFKNDLKSYTIEQCYCCDCFVIVIQCLMYCYKSEYRNSVVAFEQHISDTVIL